MFVLSLLLSSPYVVKYYGSYFKNTDLWIVMEYCGAGSVSDIIRLRNKTVSILTKSVRIKMTFGASGNLLPFMSHVNVYS